MINQRKTFDIVSQKLLIKLYHYGIRGVANKLVASYLKTENTLFRLMEISPIC